MLAENYVSAPVPTENDNTEDKEENFNKEDDIKTAMDVVTNKIIEENSPEFKQNN
ncbi:MAG: hypothetical protein LBD88_00470 [Candidatus Peribacteria bacterium]|jgi:hypothetical protein|nr:hypothetical protein [Candidatus Peribacteria bacterium]